MGVDQQRALSWNGDCFTDPIYRRTWSKHCFIPRGSHSEMIQAIFFDFNGVIINDERIHLKAYREVLLGENVPLTDEEYFASLGMDDLAFVRAAYARAGRPLADEVMHALIKREHELHRQLVTNDLPVAAGTVDFIKAAARHFELGIVSMAVHSEIDYVLELAGVQGLFSVTISAGPGLKHKPAPDSYQRALEMLNEKRCAGRKLPLLPRECLAIEDAPPGIEAARSANMHTVGVTSTVPENHLRATQADVVTPGLSDWSTEAVRRLFD
jgi:HAD superfamily hydrolase (TIGR01509 family)